MQVTVEDQSSVKKILHIEVSEHDVNRELNDAYNKLKKTAKVKGFRPGKVPRSVLEGMFKKDVHNDVTSKLIQSSFVEAIEETKLNILGHPKVDPPQLDQKGPYKYDAAVEIRPEMDDIDFKGLSLTKTLHKAGEDEVDGQIQMLRKNQAVLEPIKEDRPAKEDDAAMVDYEASKDGNPIDDLPNEEGKTMRIGQGFISKDFDQELIGMKPGDKKEFEIHMPQDYFKKDLADLDISFTVTLKEIREEILPELDDKFAKGFGQFESLDALKGEIEKNLKQGYDKRIEQELNEQIFTALIEKTDFELPDTL
ncbi:MAG: trigger factor, partial [Desulfobacula sp.]|nr:trigger factor [Desulfobacula sp.]